MIARVLSWFFKDLLLNSGWCGVKGGVESSFGGFKGGGG